MPLKLTTEERSIVVPTTIGGFFEWFEFFLFLYWTSVFSETNFSDLVTSFEELTYAILLLCSGLIARPIGGILFGWVGDKWGRKRAFFISIIAISIPSIILTFSPSFPSWAYSSLIYLAIMRLLQGIPAGGELPGALCILFEGSNMNRRKYLCSYLFVGPQLGQIMSVIFILSLQKYLSHEQLLDWGWRFSFALSSIVALIGIILRKRLHETSAFEHLRREHKIEQSPLKTSFQNYKKMMGLVLFLSILEVVGFFIIYYYFFENAKQILKLKTGTGSFTYILYLIFLTLLMPLIGCFGSKFDSVKLLKISAIGVIILSLPFYFAIENGAVLWIFFLLSMIILLFCIQFSFLPSFIAEVFPTGIRFTCIGFSFNITDGVFGGMIPLIGYWLTKITNQEGAFVLLFPASALIFLICLNVIIKEKKLYGQQKILGKGNP